MKTKGKKAYMSLLKKYAYLPLYFFSALGLDFGFRLAYRGMGVTRFLSAIPILFTLGWCLALTAVAALLPGIVKRIFMGLLTLFNVALCLVHGILANVFGYFFSFSDLAFAGNGVKFLDLSYISVKPLLILTVVLSLLFAAAAIWLTPREKYTRKRIFGSIIALAAGIGLILSASSIVTSDGDTISWEPNRTVIYKCFTDSNKSLMLTGLYHYTFRDFYISYGMKSLLFSPDDEDIKALNEYFASKTEKKDNEMTGIFSGKNLILIQLESIDDWMLTPEYMPNLYALKEQGLDFTNHYSSVYITAGTFNTEFIANTGLIPAMTGVSASVYSRNYFAYSLPRLFLNAGYTARSYHQSDGTVYDREAIHKNWGYQSYISGRDMGVSDIMLDTELMKGYDSMTENERFLDFIITISGHGPYTDQSSVSRRHMDEAKRLATTDLKGKNRDVYLHAIAHALETDAFIGQLTERLESDGLLDDTVLVFFADHYNYYVLNDELIMLIKGVGDKNMAQHTVFFAYTPDMEPRKISKVTSSADILPTIANLFGLETDYRYYIGSDAFDEDTGGYVIFSDGSWYDGRTYRRFADEYDDGYTAAMDAETSEILEVSRKVLKTDYFARRME